MQTAFPCPACAADDWDEVGAHPYWREQHEPGGVWHHDPQVRILRRVLFEVWFPGAEAVTLKSQRCCACGTTCYAPRPTDAELAAKYRFMRAAEVFSPYPSPSEAELAADAERAAMIFEALCPYLEERGRVLDVGGAHGRLMAPFVSRGFDCFLVDQVERTAPGVRKIGDRIEDVPANLRFDVAVLSHVLEHVASPLDMLKCVCEHLREGGAVYVEVPWEVFRNNAWNPIVIDPVEHVNFFTLDAIGRMLRRSGFKVEEPLFGWSSYGGNRLPVIRAVGVKPGDGVALQA